MLKAIKRAIAKFLNRLAESSQKEFGDERLDCCKLDRPNKDK